MGTILTSGSQMWKQGGKTSLLLSECSTESNKHLNECVNRSMSVCVVQQVKWQEVTGPDQVFGA